MPTAAGTSAVLGAGLSVATSVAGAAAEDGNAAVSFLSCFVPHFEAPPPDVVVRAPSVESLPLAVARPDELGPHLRELGARVPAALLHLEPLSLDAVTVEELWPCFLRKSAAVMLRDAL